MQHTQEQHAIITCQAHTIIVQALAGTGKTSTLIGYVQARPTWRFLYLAYNKAIAEEVAQRFPANVVSCTVHSLAYRAYGAKYQHKLGNNRLRDLTASLNLSSTDTARVKRALQAVNDWLVSDVDDLSAFVRKQYKRESTLTELLLDAPTIWGMMLDANNHTIKMPHDGYLKLYQMSKPVLEYDALLLDEAQDSNAVTIALVRSAQCAYKVIIGDSHQAIYRFRGATDALADFAKLDSAALFSLTHSFRFSQAIADYATRILQNMKGEDKALVGAGAAGEVQVYDSVDALPQYTTILARNNFSLFNIALEQVSAGRKVYFCGGVARYDLDLLHAIIDLYQQRHVKHVFISKFSSYVQLRAYARDAEESDVILACNMIDEYGAGTLRGLLHELVQMDAYISAAPAQRLFECQFQLVSCHRSKGLQFKRVAVWDDFTALEEMRLADCADRYRAGRLSEFEADEWVDEVNLLYVACTRATQVIFVPKLVV